MKLFKYAGNPARQSFLNILERNGITGTTTGSRVNDVPTTIDDLVPDEATIEQLGALEARFGRKIEMIQLFNL